MIFEILSQLFGNIFALFGYIKTEKLYPKPLSKTEEEYYLKKYFEGSKEAKDKLIEHNLRLVAHIAKKYSSSEQELEDYISIGTIGLIKAINSFSEEKGFKISTYASKCIENEILMNIRWSKKTKSDISMDSVIGSDKDGNDMRLLDTLVLNEKDPIETIYNSILTKQMIEYINTKLEPREKEIMVMRYGLNNNISKTQQEVADILNISRSYVSRIETKLQKKLEKIIKYEE